MRSARSKGAKDPEYLDWIRSLPCVICVRPTNRFYNYRLAKFEDRQKSRTEAAHTGPRGLSQKADDRGAIPLCGDEHHREGKESHHKLGKKFFDHHGIDRDALVAELNRKYDSIQQKNVATSSH